MSFGGLLDLLQDLLRLFFNLVLFLAGFLLQTWLLFEDWLLFEALVQFGAWFFLGKVDVSAQQGQQVLFLLGDQALLQLLKWLGELLPVYFLGPLHAVDETDEHIVGLQRLVQGISWGVEKAAYLLDLIIIKLGWGFWAERLFWDEELRLGYMIKRVQLRQLLGSELERLVWMSVLLLNNPRIGCLGKVLRVVLWVRIGIFICCSILEPTIEIDQV